jgi:ribonuclease HI
MKRIYIDGSGWNGQESRACACREDGSTIFIVQDFKEKTNNQMEYQALFEVLVHASKGEPLEIFTDSRLVVGQLTKDWKVNVDHLKVINRACRDFMSQLDVKLIWVPREKNKAGKILEKDKGFPSIGIDESKALEVIDRKTK